MKTIKAIKVIGAGGVEVIQPEAPLPTAAFLRIVCDGLKYTVYEEGDTVPPMPSVLASSPQVVTMRQARLALLAAGLLDKVDAAIDAIADPAQRAAARIEWDYSSEVHRDKPLVGLLGPALKLDDAGIDALFSAASKL
jgi:hypothetical protein